MKQGRCFVLPGKAKTLSDHEMLKIGTPSIAIG